MTERENWVLEAIVRNYIMNASPTSSRFIAKSSGNKISSATIRNVMVDLEEKGLITHTHASSGRIPTDGGYRFYVDRLMECGTLQDDIKKEIHDTLKSVDGADLHLLLDAASKVLSKATNQLGIILGPKLGEGIFRHVHIYECAHQRYTMTLAIDAGVLKSVVIELETKIPQDRLEQACRIINERFDGMTLEDMSVAGEQVFSDVGEYELGVIKLFVPSIQKLITSERSEVIRDGEQNILLKPEFFDKEKIGAIVEMLEEDDVLLHLLNANDIDSERVVVSIGGEIENGQFSSFSVVKSKYKIGHMEGCLGVIGPKRMPYPFLVSAVDYTAKMLGEIHQH